jgi:hypothetical protein
MKAQVPVVLFLVLFYATLTHAQRPVRCNLPVEYGNRNQVDPPRSTVRSLVGRVVAETGDPAKEIGAVPACLGLFTEKGHRLVASAEADQRGRFKFGVIRSGRFRLVVREPLNSFCLANLSLRVANKPRGKARELVIHMRPAGVDDCSYGEIK